MKMNLPEDVEFLISRLNAHGHRADVVGGCVRDFLLGGVPHDYDITTSATPDEMHEAFSDLRTVDTGIKHGTVTVLMGGISIEITTFRIDGAYSDSRHPESVTFTPCLDEDLARRDFTVNAMAWGEKRGLVDLFSGKSDLEMMLLRAVGDPKKRFEEDALRILRAFRFASEHGFEIEEETKEAIIEKRYGLLNISRERIYSELSRALMGDFASKALSELFSCGLMPYIFTFYSDSFAPKCEAFDLLPKKKTTRLAWLIINFPKKEAENALISLKMSNADKAAVKSILDATAFLSELDRADMITARKFLQKFGEHAMDAITVAYRLGYDVKDFKGLIDIAEGEDFPRCIADLAISGSVLTSLGAKGKQTGKLLAFLLEKATAEPSLNTPQSLISLAKKYILENKNESKDN